MLIPILFIIALLTALSGAVLENSRQAAHAAIEAQIARSASAALTDGVADFTHGLAAYVAGHGTHGPWPASATASTPLALCTSANVCPYTYVVSATITAASGSGAGADVAPSLQAAAIDEQRVSAVVSAAVSDATGAVVGTRSRSLTYRVFAASPYAVIAGSSAGADPGDTGGAVPDTAEDAAADTRIHVRLTCRTVIANVAPFQNDQQPAGNDGLPWGNAPHAAYETPCTVPEAPADAFADGRWTNGDVNASGWSQ
jgi:hypothetical protein